MICPSLCRGLRFESWGRVGRDWRFGGAVVVDNDVVVLVA